MSIIKSLRTRTCLLIVLLSFAISGVHAQNADIHILRNINPENPNSGYWKATSSSVYIVSLGAPAGLYIAGVLKKNDTLKHQAFEVFSTVVVAAVISEAFKYTINRDRPAVTYPEEIFPYKELTSGSFPSGHTSLAFGTAASLSIQFKKWYVVVPAYLWAGSVAYSRMYLGVHYPTDVLAGAAIGIGSAYLSHWLNKKLFPGR